MRLITNDDIVETYSKLYQKGLSFWLSRFNPSALSRTRATFNQAEEDGSYWWMIPAVRGRLNKLATGDENTPYETYVSNRYLDGKRNLKLLSLGCGTCTHEMRFAKQQHFSEVRCVDIAGALLAAAEKDAVGQGLTNMRFEVSNVNQIELHAEQYDIVLFHSSLHHFRGVRQLVGEKIHTTLKQKGLLIINEYVGPNRLQYPAKQLKAMNEALMAIPSIYRTRYKSRLLKRSISGAGLLRMLITDPSECVESEEILPALHRYFKVIEEKPLGSNLLMLVYKDIAHHFLTPDKERCEILEQTFRLEEKYLETASPDMVFGIYQKQ